MPSVRRSASLALPSRMALSTSPLRLSSSSLSASRGMFNRLSFYVDNTHFGY